MSKFSAIVSVLALLSISSAAFALNNDPEFEFGDDESNAAADEASAIEQPTFDAGGFSAGDFQGGELPSRYGDYSSNPAALGADALTETDPISRADYDSFFGNDYSGAEFDEWVGSIMGPQDLEEILGMDEPTVEQDCGTRSETETREVRTTYHCSVDDGSDVENPRCDRVADYPVDRDYVYRCEEDRPSTLSQWSNGCSGFEGNADCALIDERCTEYREATPASYQCETGSTVQATPYQCETGEAISQENYYCERGENVSTSNYSCERGENVTYSDHTCSDRNCGPATNSNCEEINSWCNDGPPPPSCNVTWQNAMYINQLIYACDDGSGWVVHGVSNPQMMANDIAKTMNTEPYAGANCTLTQTGGNTFRIECASGACVDETIIYRCENRSPYNNCSPGSGCSQQSTQCLQYIHGECVREQVVYICETRSAYNNCQPGGECTQQSVQCLEQHNGSCIRERVTYSCETSTPYDTCQPASNCHSRTSTCVEWHGGRCVRSNVTYQCDELTPVNTCDIPTGCTQTGTRCVETAWVNGRSQCVRTERSYSCPGEPAGCVGREEDYRCEEPAGPPPTDVIDEIGQPSWREVGCPTLDPEWECEVEETECIEGAGTRIIDGVEVYSECWREQTRYVCPGVGETITDCNPGPECTLSQETCMDDACRSSTRTYECTSETSVTTEVEQCESAISCIGGSCVEVSRENSAQQAPEALAQLAALFQAHESITNPDGSLSLMSGDDLRCHKTGIWKNCCTDDGAGIAVDWLNGSCNEEEQELAARREENLCVDVGWYCAKDGWFGCRKRKRTSCCFGSTLARIVNEEGREQLGLGWGTPEEPACEGLTPEQFSQVDLSNVDFSEVLGDMTDAFNPEGEGSIADRVQQRVSDFYTNGTPGGGE